MFVPSACLKSSPKLAPRRINDGEAEALKPFSGPSEEEAIKQASKAQRAKQASKQASKHTERQYNVSSKHHQEQKHRDNIMGNREFMYRRTKLLYISTTSHDSFSFGWTFPSIFQAAPRPHEHHVTFWNSLRKSRLEIFPFSSNTHKYIAFGVTVPAICTYIQICPILQCIIAEWRLWRLWRLWRWCAPHALSNLPLYHDVNKLRVKHPVTVVTVEWRLWRCVG